MTITIVVAIVIAVIAIVPLRFRVHFCRKGEDDFLSVTWQVIPGIWGLTMEIPFLKVTSGSIWPVIKVIGHIEGEKGAPVLEKEESIKFDWPMIKMILDHWSQILEKLKRLRKLLLWILHRISIRKLHWTTEVGTGEPAETGMLVGILSTTQTRIYRWFQKFPRVVPQNANIQVIPNFNKSVIALDIHCIFDVPCGHIIIVTIKAIYLLFVKRG